MIVSPLVLDRNVPLIGPPRGGQIEADGDEQEGVEESGSACASAQQAIASGGCRRVDVRELSTREAIVEALSRKRASRPAARQCGTPIESSTRAGISQQGTAAGAEEVRWAGGRAFRTDTGGGAFGVRGWVAHRRRNAATLDGKEETIWAVADALRAWIERYGVP